MSDEESSRRRLLPCLIENRGPTQPNSEGVFDPVDLVQT